jgi:hypothetical protein
MTSRPVSEDAWAIVQIHPREDEILPLNRLVEFDRRSYGSTLLLFYKVEKTSQESAGEVVDES